MRPSKDTQFNNQNGQSILNSIKEKFASSDNTLTQKIFSLFKLSKNDIKDVAKDAVVDLEVSRQSYKAKIEGMTQKQILNHRPNDLGPNFMTTSVYSAFDQMLIDQKAEIFKNLKVDKSFDEIKEFSIAQRENSKTSDILKKERHEKIWDNVDNVFKESVLTANKSHFDMYPISPDKAYFEKDLTPRRVTLKM